MRPAPNGCHASLCRHRRQLLLPRQPVHSLDYSRLHITDHSRLHITDYSSGAPLKHTQYSLHIHYLTHKPSILHIVPETVQHFPLALRGSSAARTRHHWSVLCTTGSRQ